MATVNDVPADKLIEEVSKDLKENFEEIQEPEWSDYVKTASNKERAPEQRDWWFTRTAALLRKVYLKQPIGVGRLRKYYGGKDKSESTPEHFQKGSGSIIRTSLQQLEEAGLVTKSPEGRKITSEGRSYLDQSSSKLYNKVVE
ncbi:MAG: Ribosomal protein S19E [Candidatus Methanohalarchaeum thermophilum]|uniref:Small ribosomal subunit protein eS19 n=1 Tax=Methanohalarchaeum thermophilum TaxID=1903181 RepID=A0A1Q6DXU7_METT1|nr:MAG: Ribosomal protein S19E [Candidatus Methanohalarchaeum thermophilum]